MQPVNNLFSSLYNSLPSVPRAAVIGGTLCTIAAPVFALKNDSEVVADPGYSVLPYVTGPLVSLGIFILIMKLCDRDQPPPAVNLHHVFQPPQNNVEPPQNNAHTYVHIDLPIETQGRILILRGMANGQDRIYRNVGMENTGKEVREAIIADSNLYPTFWLRDKDGVMKYLELEDSDFTIEQILQMGNVDVENFKGKRGVALVLSNAATSELFQLDIIKDKPARVKSAANI